MAFKNLGRLVALSFLMSNVVGCSCDATPPEVDLGYARYSGTFDEVTKTTRFLGIRYAAPPTGVLRWQRPQPPAFTPGVQKADAQPATCYITGPGSAPAAPFHDNGHGKRDAFFPSEDCLFLNVFHPEIDSKKKLPVIVWIHGGGYHLGSASGYSGQDAFDGNDIIQQANGGVITVVIQYRLGVFGFLPGSKIKKHGALNAGLLDQQFALQWVQKYIHKFGGDPSQVTIWGESAGAGSVIQHLIANDGNTKPPLFRAGMASSVFLPAQYQYNDHIPENLYKEVVAKSNCSSAGDSLECLRNADVSVLQNANNIVAANAFFGTFTFVPVVDGTFIRERPIEAFRHGKLNSRTILAMTNSFEGGLFIDPKLPADVDVANHIAQLFPKLGLREAQHAAALYKNLGSPIFQVTTIMSESIFLCPTYYLLRASKGQGFKSELAIAPAGHGNDLFYYWPSTNPTGVPPYNNTAFRNAFAQSFTDFALSHNPNRNSDQSNITPKWGSWNGGVEMLFNKTEAGEPDIRAFKTSKALLERCQFWESVGALIGQ